MEYKLDMITRYCGTNKTFKNIGNTYASIF